MCVPNERCIAAQSTQMKTPCVTDAHEGTDALQSKHSCARAQPRVLGGLAGRMGRWQASRGPGPRRGRGARLLEGGDIRTVLPGSPRSLLRPAFTAEDDIAQQRFAAQRKARHRLDSE